MRVPPNRPVSFTTVTLSLAGLLFASLLMPVGDAQEDLRFELLPNDPEALSVLFAPVLMFTDGELYRPIPAEAFLQNADLKRSGEVVAEAPVPPEVLAAHASADLYLDLPDDSPESYASLSAQYPTTVYARVAPLLGGLLLQYWFFYLYNDGINQHEGDWELISLLLESSGRPQWAAYSQHNTATVRHWTNVERFRSHPVVYVAQGSHASYFAAADFPLRFTPCGPTGLDAAFDAVALEPEEYNLVLLANQPWLDFGGHWGETSFLPGGSGPHGPEHRTDGCDASLWAPPLGWFDGLPPDREDSLIPRRGEMPHPRIQVLGPRLRGESLTFSAVNSTDDGEVVYAEWNLGDGAFVPGLEVSHTYHVTGAFVATLTLMDDDGLLNATQVRLNIRDAGDERGVASFAGLATFLWIAVPVAGLVILLGYVLWRRTHA